MTPLNLFLSVLKELIQNNDTRIKTSSLFHNIMKAYEYEKCRV